MMLATIAQALGVEVSAVEGARDTFNELLGRKKPFVRGDQVEVADRLLSVLAGSGKVVSADGEMYLFERSQGIWTPVGDHTLMNRVADFAGASVVSGDKLRPLCISYPSMLGVVQIAHHRASSPGFFDEAVHGAAFKNGFVALDEVGELVLKPHDPEARARHRFECDFDPTALPSRFLEFLSSVWRGDPEATQKIELVRQYVGLCLLGLGAASKRVLALVGNTNSGKSTLITMIRHLFPPDALASIGPAQFGNEYYRAQLPGRLLNTVSELPEQDWLDSSSFKALTGNDSVHARNPHGRPFFFTPRSGHILASNTLPGINDRSDASHRRLCVVEFSNRFKQGEQDEGEQPADPNIARDIVEAERGAIASWCLVGAAVAVANGLVLPHIASSDEAIKELRINTDQVLSFVMDECELEPTARCVGSALYDRYREWAKDGGFHPMHRNSFAKALVAHLKRKYPGMNVRSQDSSKSRTYCGIGLRTRYQPAVQRAADVLGAEYEGYFSLSAPGVKS